MNIIDVYINIMCTESMHYEWFKLQKTEINNHKNNDKKLP